MDFSIARSLEILGRTPSTLRALLGGLSDEWTAPNEGPDTFSAFDNVAHLAHLERTSWVQRAEVILGHGTAKTFPSVERFAHYRESEGKDIAQVLDDFADSRDENLREVRGWNLSKEQLDLEGEHPAFGTVTLRQLLAAWTVHDLGHLAQISRVLAKQYRKAVGPWREYLPILDR